ncbi:hypothetical protein [Pseudomonas delhiensis]|uniref:hypothetical protein n=1 Tax=Pseudomonas delhiensis TaxID=366289 RepID=UPI00111388BE|nr:hypothetical protein [Pseudomonas delhiensis]
MKSWSHPFGAKSDPLQQLTNLAKAQAGYFPLGRNGLWHGGVHFDSGTAGTVGPEGQSHVRCLADGEVIAYRIPEHTPKTKFFPAPGVTVDAPFASGFVLVRHRLEAPRIEGKTESPPALIFYSLYMHLADWDSYQADIRKARPAFWPESSQRRVKETNEDRRRHHPDERGLNLRHSPLRGKTIGFLPRGATVTVSGTGEYRKVEGIKGPVDLQNPDGTLRGYVSVSVLQDLGGGIHRVNTHSDDLNVRATPSTSGTVLFKLPKGTELTISGTEEFRKLESVTQYIHFASLEPEHVPECGKVVVLDKPVPIKAGHLIGHLGPYQDCRDGHPQEKLHLEVFACENVETFFKKSRDWAKDLPEKEKTWLKLEAGTKAVIHQDSYSAATPPDLNHAHSVSSAPLLLPRSMLDGLAADRKIKVPASEAAKAKSWYRLENLLIGTDGKLLPDVWVCDEVGKTPWVSPWSWDGFDVIYNNDPPHNALSYFLKNMGNYFDEKELAQWQPLADASDKGPVRQRLFDIIDANRNGKIEAQEVQQALSIPAYAQSISQLVIHYESEWYYQQRKWDSLDQVMGHTPSTPILNWAAEKTRIKELSWWGEVAERGILPKDGTAYHFNPIGMAVSFISNDFIFTLEIMQAIYPDLSPSRNSDLQEIATELNGNLDFYKLDTPLRRAHFFAQILQETGSDLAVTEGFYYSSTSLKSLFSYFRAHPNEADAHGYSIRAGKIKSNGEPMGQLDFEAIANGAYGGRSELGNGSYDSGDGWRYRGRGLKQLTGRYNYSRFTEWHNSNSSLLGGGSVNFLQNPDLLSSMKYAARSAAFFWLSNNLYSIADRGATDDVVNSVTNVINHGTDELSRRGRRGNFARLWSNRILH